MIKRNLAYILKPRQVFSQTANTHTYICLTPCMSLTEICTTAVIDEAKHTCIITCRTGT